MAVWRFAGLGGCRRSRWNGRRLAPSRCLGSRRAQDSKEVPALSTGRVGPLLGGLRRDWARATLRRRHSGPRCGHADASAPRIVHAYQVRRIPLAWRASRQRVKAFRDRHVVLGVSGGIACYKSCILARRLTEAGARVDVALTHGAAEFVRPLTFEALTGRPVLSSLWEPGGALAHVRLGQRADLVLVAPATAHLIARMAQGLADDLLTTLLVASTSPILLAPAMNDEMYAHPQTRANLERVRARGVSLVGPEIGALAEGPSERPGRMSEPETILAHAARCVRGSGRLAARRVVVTA